MDPIWLALAFTIVGILLLIAEYAAPKSYLVVPGAVLLVLGILTFIFPTWVDAWWSMIVLAIVLVLMLYAAIKFYQMLAPASQQEAMVLASIVGKKGVVKEEIVPNETTGKISVEARTLNATADVKIPAGTQVIITEDKGSHVVVAVVAEGSIGPSN